MTNSTPGSSKRKFVALLAASAVGLFAYFYWAKTRTSSPPELASRPELPQAAPQAVEPGAVNSPSSSTNAEPVAEPESGPKSKSATEPRPPSKTAPHVAEASAQPVSPPRQILFRYMATDSHYGKLAVAGYPDVSQLRFINDFSCQVVHFAAGVGICLTADRGVFTKYGADLFNSEFERSFHIDLEGIPSRCRVSPDGKLAAWTVFVTGHSYDSVDFSTQTMLIHTANGEPLGDLEKFAVTFDGRPFQSPDFNFWGVTFTADSKSFYCTLSSQRKHYLVRGDIGSRTVAVIRENVECPSLSPDGTKIAFKKRFVIDKRVVWKLHILDLATMQDSPLVEERSVDDQLAWLDNSHVLYTLPATQTRSSATTSVWMAAIDGSEPPKLFLPVAYSPVVIR